MQVFGINLDTLGVFGILQDLLLSKLLDKRFLTGDPREEFQFAKVTVDNGCSSIQDKIQLEVKSVELILAPIQFSNSCDLHFASVRKILTFLRILSGNGMRPGAGVEFACWWP